MKVTRLDWRPPRKKMSRQVLKYVTNRRLVREKKAADRLKAKQEQQEFQKYKELIKKEHNLTEREFFNLPQETLAILYLKHMQRLAPSVIFKTQGNKKIREERTINFGYKEGGLNDYLRRLAEGEVQL